MEAKRCSVHGLVAGADGRCVLCRRQPGHEPEAEPSPTRGRVMLTVAILVAAGFAIGSRMRSRHQETASTRSALDKPAEVEPLPARALAQPIDDSDQQDADVEAFGGRLPERAPAKDASVATTEPDSGSEPPSPPAVDELVLRGRQRREDEAQMARLRESFRRVQITVYFTEWCPVCSRARRWLTARGYSYTELDVEKDLSAKEVYLRLNPRGSIPTINIDGQVVIGFSELSVANAIASAARKRMGQ